MRVMQIIYSFDVGGSEIVARDIALDIRKIIVHGVAALEFDGPLRRILNDAGVRTWVVNKQPSERLGAMLRLWAAMRSFKPDIVHTHHLYQLVHALPGALLSGARIIHTEHEYYSLMTPKAGFMLRHLSRYCLCVTGVNEATSAFLKEEVRVATPKVSTVLNGINLERYDNCRSNRAALGLADNDLIVGIVARLTQVKDHQMLLRAFRIVSEKLPRAKLLIIGDGPTRSKLELLTGELGLKQCVFFLGVRFDVPELLSCLDVAVLSSKEEGLPLSILEAMAAGKPVVATDVGGVSAVVKQGETGLLVPPGNSNAMALALLDILDDPSRAEKMGRCGRNLIEQHYDSKNTIEKYWTLYEKAMR